MAAAFVAVLHAERSSIVPSGDDSVVTDKDTANGPFHAVGSGGGNVGYLHEVTVPAGPQ